MSRHRFGATLGRLVHLAAKTARVASTNGLAPTWRRVICNVHRRGVAGLVQQADQEQAFLLWLEAHRLTTAVLTDLVLRRYEKPEVALCWGMGRWQSGQMPSQVARID